MMAARLLPLFPLSVVLLPATPLPLHIFEERYKQMMQDLLPPNEEEFSGVTDREFGVVLAKQEGILSIGCTATVQRVLEGYPDGRLVVVAIGQRRFRVTLLDEELPYLRAEVEYFDDDDASEEAPPDLKQRAVSAYEKLRAVESPGVIVEPALDSSRLSFQLGQFISDLEKRQALLTMHSEVERLKFLVAVLPQYTTERQQVALAKRLAPTNGHAKHLKDF